jgi:hypothetical protein
MKQDCCSPNLKLKTRARKNQNYCFKPLTPELNPSAQRCLTRFFTGDFGS